MIKRNDSILVFEYFTSSGEKDKSIISEAEALIFSLINELSEFNIDLVIHKDYENKLDECHNVNPIFIDENITDWLKVNASKFDRAIFIAGENNNNLFAITKILEENNVRIYTSSAEACFKTSDKYETYLELFNIIPQPESYKFTVDSNGDWIGKIKKLKFDKLIIKPLIGVDCEDIIVVDDSFDNFDNIFSRGSEIIVQEFIEGIDVSVSLISDGKKAVPISLNKQFIDIENNNQTYIGGTLPYENEYKNKAFEIASRAVESINGLKGFVGVDLIINNDEIYLLEINSRFTTPYVGLKKIANINIASSIINVIDKKIDIDDLNITLEGNVEFKKSKDSLEIRRI